MTKRFKKVKKNMRKSVVKQEKINFNSLHSTSSSDSSTISKAVESGKETGPLIIADTTPDILQELYSEEESEDLPQNPPIKSLTEDLDYFNNFLHLPDINSIAEDINIIAENENESFSKDLEQFGDAAAFIKLQHNIHFASQISLVEASLNDSEEQQSELNDVLLEDFKREEQTSRQTIIELENAQTGVLLEKLFDLNLKATEQNVDEIDLEVMAKQRDKEQLHQQTLKFINDLVQRVTEKAEFRSEELVLRQNLDKRKLLEEIFNLYRKVEEEKNISKLLNSKVAKFYKRKNMYSQIKPDKAKNMAQEKVRYSNAIKHLDDVLAVKRDVEVSMSRTIAQLNNELQEMKRQIQNEILLFEGAVKKNFCRAESTQLNTNIVNLLKIMAKSRQEVGDVRFQMIIKQDAYAQLLNKVSRFEDLGNAITLNYYNRIQTENFSLEKKIEDSNAVLKKLHQRLRKSIHFLAHVKEKQRMFKAIFAKQHSDYEKLNNKCNSLRTYCHQLKLKSSRIRKEMENVDIQNGMLNKPALLYDYDKTEERLSEQREIVRSLRIKMEMIQQNISKLENPSIKDNQRISFII